MGLFKKLGLVLSGVDGQIEANILTAFNYLEQSIAKEVLINFHYKNQVPFLAFSWAIARECYLSIHPEERYSSGVSEDGRRMALLTKRVLEDIGYQITVNLFTTSLEEDLNLAECGENYMIGVLDKNRTLYMEAIKNTVNIIKKSKAPKKKLPSKQSSQTLFIRQKREINKKLKQKLITKRSAETQMKKAVELEEMRLIIENKGKKPEVKKAIKPKKTTSKPSNNFDYVEKLKDITLLLEKGAISQAEFRKLKKKIMGTI